MPRNRAQDILEKVLPGVPIKASAQYRDLYLFRIEWPSEAEKNYDPFVSVNIDTGEVRDFSVLPVLSEISKLEWKEI